MPSLALPRHFLTFQPSEYETSGALHEQSSFGPPYGQPSYNPHLFQSCPIDNAHDGDHFHYVAHPDLPVHARTYDSSSTMVDHRFRPTPQVILVSQLEGAQGSTVRLHLQSPHDLRGSPKIIFSMLFATRSVECAVQLISDPYALVKQYALSAEAPAFTPPVWQPFAVPLRLMMEGSHGNTSSLKVEVGNFTYNDHINSPDSSRKRRLSSSSGDAARRCAKKQSAQQLQIEAPTAAATAAYGTSPYSSFISTPIAASLSHLGTEGASSPHLSSHQYSASVASAPSVRAPSPRTPNSWSPSVTPRNPMSAASKVDAILPQAPTGDAPAGKTPALIRTSTLRQSSPGPGSAAPAPPFNPWAIYPSKALLKLNGELNSMADGWSNDEWDAKRRLVQFTRRQKGSTIHADFKTVAPEDRLANTICISCIWWEEKQDYYVTSVDTIFLLESLVAVRFTVEEKNRIRRNLEGFHPLTVSKSKADSEEFFKIIMGFPNPKPRNIEKDVKVFPWKILADALKKIIGKYSASYSSTAGALPTPTMSHNGASESGTDVRASTSPQLKELHPAASPFSGATMSMSPHVSQQGGGVPIRSGPSTELRLQVPLTAPGFANQMTHSFPPSSQYRHNPNPRPQSMTAPATSERVLGAWHGGEGAPFDADMQDPTTANMNAYNYNRFLGSLRSSSSYVPAPCYTIPQSGM